MMRLTTQFRVLAADGTQHSIARYCDSRETPGASRLEHNSTDIFRMNGAEDVVRIDDDTFVTPLGQVLRRATRSA